MNNQNYNELPLGLGMALAKNFDAMTYFTNLTKAEQQKIIDHTHSIGSKQEMQAYVQSLTS